MGCETVYSDSMFCLFVYDSLNALCSLFITDYFVITDSFRDFLSTRSSYRDSGEFPSLNVPVFRQQQNRELERMWKDSTRGCSLQEHPRAVLQQAADAAALIGGLLDRLRGVGIADNVEFGNLASQGLSQRVD